MKDNYTLAKIYFVGVFFSAKFNTCVGSLALKAHWLIIKEKQNYGN